MADTATETAAPAPRRSWSDAARVYLNPRVLGMVFLGFSAGLPFLLVFTTLQFWLAEAGIDPSTNTLIAWIGITYSIKFFWAPLVDRLRLPALTRLMGRRRGWMLAAMIGIAVGLAGMAMTDPAQDLTLMVWFALLVAFSSATQDVALDAYRIEAVPRHVWGAMAAAYQFGYRVALLCAGAGALYVAEFASWSTAYWAMAALTSVGIVTVLIIREPKVLHDRDAWSRESRVVAFMERSAHLPSRWRAVSAWFIGAVVCPFLDFFSRKGSLAVVILIFIAVFRISDLTMGSTASQFYVHMGFSKIDVANVSKIFGFFMTMLGAFLGGLAVSRFGIMRPLVAAAALIALTTTPFALLAVAGPDIPLLALVISMDNITGGFSGTVFIAYLSSLTSANYTATQYALFSSLMTFFGKFIAGWSGPLLQHLFGLRIDVATRLPLNPEVYADFYIFAAAIGLPSVLLALYLARLSRRRDGDARSQASTP